MSDVDRAVTTRFSARNGRPCKGQDGWSDGRVVVERQRLGLIRSGNGFLIDTDDVLSSRTISQ